jgi:hypothetical protein
MTLEAAAIGQLLGAQPAGSTIGPPLDLSGFIPRSRLRE